MVFAQRHSGILKNNNLPVSKAIFIRIWWEISNGKDVIDPLSIGMESWASLNAPAARL